MSDGYTKLFSSIVTSTVWQEPDHVRLVWITMLALADAHGTVQGSVPGLAHLARQSIEKTEDALRRLMAPDPYSRTKAHGGRRLEEIAGGWFILNYSTHRHRASDEDRRAKAAERQRRHRARQNDEETERDVTRDSVTERDSNASVTESNAKSRQAEAEAEAEADPTHIHTACAQGEGVAVCDAVGVVDSEDVDVADDNGGGDGVTVIRPGQRPGARETRQKLVAQILITGYKERYQRARGQEAPPLNGHYQHFYDAAGWVIREASSKRAGETAVAQCLLDGFFADEWAQAADFPPKNLASKAPQHARLGDRLREARRAGGAA